MIFWVWKSIYACVSPEKVRVWNVQVQEASLKWKVTILQYTVVQMRAALVPHKTRITKVLSALFAAPSKVPVLRFSPLLSVYHPLRGDAKVHEYLMVHICGPGIKREWFKLCPR